MPKIQVANLEPGMKLAKPITAQTIPKKEALANLDARFAKVEGKPYMNQTKKIVKEQIEGLYE